jgi:aryl-alcohol dehydrogenase-like predicted oxidoreductase
MSIERRPFGRTGLSVSILGFGAMDLAGPPVGSEISDAESDRLLNTVLDSGINFIDTAPCYGISEDRLGRVLAKRRDEIVLASKCGCVPGQTLGSAHKHDAGNIRAGVEQSLKRMRTDHLDVVQIHMSLDRKAWEAEGAVEELLRLKEEGKIRFIGVSGILPNLVEQIDSGVFDVFQIPYSALQREHETIIDKASDGGAGIIIRGAVARGTPENWDKTYYMLSKDQLTDRWSSAGLDEILQGESRIEFMIRFAISHPGLDTTIIGTTNIAHLQNNIAAAQRGPYPAELIARVKQVLDRTDSRPVH